MLNDRKFCFIICYNQRIYLEECLLYLDQLHIPEGYSADILTIEDAPSMAAGYQAAMEKSDAKYKIYMHQDVFIFYPFFLDSLLQIFQSWNRIGMIGMVGTQEFPADYVMWNGKRVGNVCYKDMPPFDYQSYRYRLEDGLYIAEAVDGFLMATAFDVPWRADLFDGWDFYDISQSFEFTKQKYKIVVPNQYYPWCLHDDGMILNLWNYDKYRRICMEEYAATDVV